jgi:adenylate cyclase
MSNPLATSSECAVLFADLKDSTALYERLGVNDAFTLIKRCLEAMALCVQQAGGRLVKNTGDGIMAVLASADAAAEVSLAIHKAMHSVSQMPETGVAVRIGFCFGPVVDSESDVFGETVNLAARLCEMGSPGICMITRETASMLDKNWQHMLRPGPPVTLKGISRQIDIMQLLFELGGDLTAISRIEPGLQSSSQAELRLYSNGNAMVLCGDAFRLTLGRDPSVDLRVSDPRASRNHCEIVRRGGRTVLIDHSSNGTFVSIEGEREFMICREETALHGHGAISFGQPRATATDTVKFFCL